MEEKLIDIKKVMEYISLSKTKIYELMKLGEFPKSRKIGGKALWSHLELQDFLRNQKNENVA